MDHMPPTESLGHLSLGGYDFFGHVEYDRAQTTTLHASSSSLPAPVTHFAFSNVLPLRSMSNGDFGSSRLTFADPRLPESGTSAPPRARQEDQSHGGRVQKRDRLPSMGEYKVNPARPVRTMVFRRERKRVETPKRRRNKDDEKRAAVYSRRFIPCKSNCKTRKKACTCPTLPPRPSAATQSTTAVMPPESESDRSLGPRIPVPKPIGHQMNANGDALVDALFPSPPHLQMLTGVGAGFDGEDEGPPVLDVHLPFCDRRPFCRCPLGLKYLN